MNHKQQTTIRILMALLIVSAGVAAADDLVIDWYTVDGGGEMRSSGGIFELSGTIGQPDAGEMQGEPYSLSGGFWAAPPCWCLADMNNDGLRNGEDIQTFVDCMTGGVSDCACADIETDSVLDIADVAMFVDDLLIGGDCP